MLPFFFFLPPKYSIFNFYAHICTFIIYVLLSEHNEQAKHEEGKKQEHGNKMGTLIWVARLSWCSGDDGWGHTVIAALIEARSISYDSLS